MAFRSRFVVGLALRAGLLLLAAFAFVQSLYVPGLGAARVVAALMCIGAGALLWRFIQRTNVEIARFIDAVRFGDLSQGFAYRWAGSGFAELGEALDQGIRKLRDERHNLSDANRFYEAVLDDAPIALLTVEADGKVELANKAARRLLVRHTGVRTEDFAEYGDAFAKALAGGSVGRPRLVPLMTEGVPQTAMISAAVVHRLGGLVRVVAVQPIQSELNAIEIAAQSDLIRVLTHEIMNSMTPVTSLAHTAAKLMSEVESSDPNVRDARTAVETLARRADGVMHFVESYRQISRAPEVRRRTFEALPWALEIEALFRAGAGGEGVRFTLSVDPESLALDADPDLLCQVLINLLRNGAEAARAHSAEPRLSLSFALTQSGRTQIEIADNGAGVPEALRQDIFLPFFTTKQKGTGVGLSLARQVVLAHRGSIAVDEAEGGGALFRILI
ncbi:sensor histidine kinase [Allosphingosinicella sp.]|jgi:nitrogen fixation/metabolism regulation signal transduction histidine kinase|uniref:sensor histidine kinase n=1 Tax=Allosphingosinicella sp. TaxID=2823234 RepID=UPI002EFA8187